VSGAPIHNAIAPPGQSWIGKDWQGLARIGKDGLSPDIVMAIVITAFEWENMRAVGF